MSSRVQSTFRREEAAEHQWKAYGDALLARFGLGGAGDAYARARWEAHATAPLFPDAAGRSHS